MCRNNVQFRQGFSLLEMTVVLGIVAIMTAISLWEMPKLKGGLSIDIVAQELAIYIRGAQVYTRATKITAREPGAGDPQSKYHSFGMHFTRGKGTFFLWNDAEDRSLKSEPDTSFAYYPTAAIEENYELPKGYKVSNIFTDGRCNGVPYTASLGEGDIVFKRPDPEANFSCELAVSAGCSGSSICGSGSQIWIEIESPNTVQTRSIRVSNNGQIVVLKDKQ